MSGTILKYALKVEGMTCGGCEKIVQEKLKEMNGVIEAKADHKAHKVELEYDLAQINMGNIIDSIKKLNYTPKLGTFEKIKLKKMERKEAE